ncbi:hypothetical protein ACO2Q9_11035 [Variovorax sp. VNK109]
MPVVLITPGTNEALMPEIQKVVIAQILRLGNYFNITTIVVLLSHE